MKSFKYLSFFLTLVVSVLCFTSCKDDDSVPELVPTQDYKIVVVDTSGTNNMTADYLSKTWLKRTWQIEHVSEQIAREYFDIACDDLLVQYAKGIPYGDQETDKMGNIVSSTPFTGVLDVTIALVNEAGEQLATAKFQFTDKDAKRIN